MSANGVNELDLLQDAKLEVNNLRDRLQQRRSELQDMDVATYARRNNRHVIKYARGDFRPCRTLRGHTGKIYSLDWSYRNRNRIVSASQDGRLIVWNALTSQKTHAIKLTCSWVMTCAFSPDGHSVACGGLDNNCSIFHLNSHPEPDGNLPVLRVLSGHRGYLSCCRYVPDDAHIITSSGDRTCRLWDGETFNSVATFGGDSTSGHAADVMSVSISTSNQKLFVSGSCDKTARLWDTRVASRPQHTYYGHRDDINAVQFLPDGLRFGTGSEDGTCRLFDTRTGHQLQKYEDPNLGSSSVTSLAFSHSGRILFAGYDNQQCYLWDAMLAEVLFDIGNNHSNRISCLGVASDGSALCTGSWDSSLKMHFLFQTQISTRKSTVPPFSTKANCSGCSNADFVSPYFALRGHYIALWGLR